MNGRNIGRVRKLDGRKRELKICLNKNLYIEVSMDKIQDALVKRRKRMMKKAKKEKEMIKRVKKIRKTKVKERIRKKIKKTVIKRKKKRNDIKSN